jgi:hypothetical protein
MENPKFKEFVELQISNLATHSAWIQKLQNIINEICVEKSRMRGEILDLRERGERL